MDAKSILDALIKGASQSSQPMREQPGSLGGLGDIMGEILKRSQGGQGAGLNPNQGQGQGMGMGLPAGLEDIFKDMMGGQTPRHMQPDRNPRAKDYSGQERLDDILDQFGGKEKMGDLFGQARDLIAKNPQMAAAIMSGLGGILVGTKSGRSILGKAARLGGVAMIGMLAYNAYKKYNQGQSMSPSPQAGADDDLDFSLPKEQMPMPPSGSGFEPEAVSSDQAFLMLRAMIAAAAADGDVSADERRSVLQNLQQVGFDEQAKEFIQDEFDNPATPADLAEGVRDEQTAAKVYTAARVVIDPDTYAEKGFLDELAGALKLDQRLVDNIDAAARQARA